MKILDDNSKFLLSVFLGPLVTIISLFIADIFLKKNEARKYRLSTIESAYEEFYLPLIKFLMSANKDNMTYYYLIAVWYGAPKQVRKSTDQLDKLLHQNLKYLPPEVIKLVSEYTTSTAGARMFFGLDSYQENYLDSLRKASDLFDKIVKASLKEASLIANKLGYPNIAKPILESFVGISETKYNYPRYLPEIYHTAPQKRFEEPEPPSY